MNRNEVTVKEDTEGCRRSSRVSSLGYSRPQPPSLPPNLPPGNLPSNILPPNLLPANIRPPNLLTPNLLRTINMSHRRANPPPESVATPQHRPYFRLHHHRGWRLFGGCHRTDITGVTMAFVTGSAVTGSVGAASIVVFCHFFGAILLL